MNLSNAYANSGNLGRRTLSTRVSAKIKVKGAISALRVRMETCHFSIQRHNLSQTFLNLKKSFDYFCATSGLGVLAAAKVSRGIRVNVSRVPRGF